MHHMLFVYTKRKELHVHRRRVTKMRVYMALTQDIVRIIKFNAGDRL